ncbi:hypothetical protein BH09ACT12_BH09ACT12_09060 [soil metagenome]
MSRVAVVLPGRAYPAAAPALSTVSDVAARHGYDVRAVEWTLDAVPDDPAGFVVARLIEAAPDGVDLIIAKSLGSWAAAWAAAQRTPAVWVTPVLTEPLVAAGIGANSALQLVLAGLADPFHDTAIAAGLDCDLCELPGVDHALSATGDGIVAPDILGRLADATDAFLRRSAWQE